MIRVTHEAKEYIISTLTKYNKSIFKVSVVKGGCSGLRYKFHVIDECLDSDELIKFDEYSIAIDSNALIFVAGSVLTYEKTLTGHLLLFKNPNEQSKCGCGRSFNVR